MDKYVCIHGHFYQPPRENPWLEYVELQDSAYPYHDWNARITEECYRQNAASRILGPDKKIIEIVNNYESISFDFGPTLMYWLESHAPDVYEKVLEADRRSREKFSGHGCAMAQAYNHMILPLANAHDKQTQVIWGIEDFKRRFQREPEGMWLPETAVDMATLEVLVDHGIKFTILAPRQAKRARRLSGARRWRDVNEGDVDTSVPYICNLPSGKQITLFFYNGPVSHDIAYGGLLHSGENFAMRLVGSFPNDGEQSHLVHVATDGESFGHHHHHGDMALAYCLHHIEANNLAKITIYGEYLEKFPPDHEAEIWENSSWSCVHGVERWRSNCGCAADQSRSGQQQWRAPLREAIDWLRDRLATVYQDRMSTYSPDPWRVRNEYIRVINDRSPENVDAFVAKAAGRELEHHDKVTFLKLLEMQRNGMLMYTSCGWFFDNISGIETVQVMMYASRAMQLCHEVQNWNLEPEFKNMLAERPDQPAAVRQRQGGLRGVRRAGPRRSASRRRPLRLELGLRGILGGIDGHLLLFRQDRGFRARRGGRADPDDEPDQDSFEHHAGGVRGRFGGALPGRPSSLCVGAGTDARRAVQANPAGPGARPSARATATRSCG